MPSAREFINDTLTFLNECRQAWQNGQAAAERIAAVESWIRRFQTCRNQLQDDDPEGIHAAVDLLAELLETAPQVIPEPFEEGAERLMQIYAGALRATEQIRPRDAATQVFDSNIERCHGDPQALDYLAGLLADYGWNRARFDREYRNWCRRNARSSTSPSRPSSTAAPAAGQTFLEHEEEVTRGIINRRVGPQRAAMMRADFARADARGAQEHARAQASAIRSNIAALEDIVDRAERDLPGLRRLQQRLTTNIERTNYPDNATGRRLRTEHQTQLREVVGNIAIAEAQLEAAQAEIPVQRRNLEDVRSAGDAAVADAEAAFQAARDEYYRALADLYNAAYPDAERRRRAIPRDLRDWERTARR